MASPGALGLHRPILIEEQSRRLQPPARFFGSMRNTLRRLLRVHVSPQIENQQRQYDKKNNAGEACKNFRNQLRVSSSVALGQHLSTLG